MLLPIQSAVESRSYVVASEWSPRRVDVPRVFPSGGSPSAPPGCVFTGTSCYGVVQICHYECGDGGSSSSQCGWCFGFW